jgi:hypothetical protein
LPLGLTVGRLNIRGDMTLEWLASLLANDSTMLEKLGRRHRIKETAKRWMGDAAYAKVWSLLNRQEREASAE